MNHCVAIRANDGEVRKFCFAWFCSVGERFEMMNLRVITTKFAVDNFKIKTTFWHFTFQFAVSIFPCFPDFGIPECLLALTMSNER